MNYESYKKNEKEIKRKCRTRFGLIVGGLAGLLFGGKFALEKLDIDVNKYLWIQYPAYVSIYTSAFYYARKEPKRLSVLDEIYEKNKEEPKKKID
jgi:hypothetical protein